MKNYINDKGIQASAVTAGVLAVLTATVYSPPVLAIWAVWAGVTAWAVWVARGKAHA